MEGNIQQIVGFIRSSHKIYIPVYQRNYDWTKENCQRLWEDLLMIHDDNKKSHFFGSIVVKPANLPFESIVIDGQQRITTISILLLAMRNWMLANENNDTQDLNIKPDILERSYLITELVSESEKYKLRSNPRDYKAYLQLFKDRKFHHQTSNLTNSYNFFYRMLETKRIEIDDLHLSIQKLQVMVVNLNSPDDDPQMIFESLNSTGLELTEGDKIRNFLLMNEDPSVQNDLFVSYWQPFEERVEFEISDFFFYYLSMKNAKSPKKDRIYDEFSTYYNKSNRDKILFFEELSNYSLAYGHLLKPRTDSLRINAILNRFNELDTTVVRSYTMAIINDYYSERFSENSVVEILSVLESYIARRMITKLSSNALNKILSTLSRDVDRLLEKDKNANPVDVISYILLSKTNTGRFPNDTDVIESLRANDFYNVNRRFRTYLFERLENYDHYEAIDIYGGIQRQDYSIEHIMPRTLNSVWMKELGNDYSIVHDRYLNNIGNLTLTGYNSKYSNNSFKEKQNIEKGFKDSHFRYLNKLPASAESWNEEHILNRTEDIVNRALQIWSYPQSTFQPKVKEKEMIIYDGQEYFTNYLIKGYTFIDDTYHDVSTWKDLLVDITKTLMEININPIQRLIEQDIGLARYFSSSKMNKATKITDTFYLKTGISNYGKMEIINHLFELYDIEYDSLTLDAALKG